MYPALEKWHDQVPRSTTRPILFGLAVLVACGAAFGAWGAMAPLASAVVAPGAFVATGQNKQVQHLEGGIISELLVREGDRVAAGAPLVRLDDTAARARLQRLVLRRHRLAVMAARLQAEVEDKDTMETPLSLRAEVGRNPALRQIIEAQEAELRARRSSVRGQEAVFRREVAALEETIRGYNAQVEANGLRRAYFSEELKSKQGLLDQNLIRKSDVLALQRSEASLAGEVGELMGRIGEAKERAARADQQIAQLRASVVQKGLEELRNVTTEADDLHEQILAARDVAERVEVRAPVAGTVVKLNYYTAAGVVAPGSVILELLPADDELVIEGRVNPTDIPYVKDGQDALVRLTALNHRLTPMIRGRVAYISADTINEQARASATEGARRTFVVRVRLDEQDVREKVENFRPLPGMPADIYIETGTRTFFTYLMRPILDSFSRAFRER